jgi:aspartate aminotransferase-like enzyme
VGTLLQIHRRLKDIEARGGVEAETQRIGALAADFRQKVSTLPFTMASPSPQNGVTSLRTDGCSAYEIFTILKDEYQIWICPNGGELRDSIFRVGHLGALTKDDNTTLVDAMLDMKKKGIVR